MDPKKVKLTIRETAGPFFATCKESSQFIICISIFVAVFIENALVACLMPVLIPSSFILNALFSFGLAIIVQAVSLLPAVLFLVWWFDADKSGEDMYVKFRKTLNEALDEKRKEVLANAEQEMLK